ncbi:hypothetical protein COO60DRAFT_1635480 [Scenedesmus sp. NREL 46B-D3]|nr:hypothetical protein COO60DRAFT_1635480 [Scenedesmus sp. NREL 46B-D3]
MLNIYVYMLAVACLRLSVEAAGKTVHVVFSNHLVRFDNIEPYTGYDSNVLNMYFNRYLPLAVDNAAWMQRVSPHGDKYVYTTHAFVLLLFLDCPSGMGLQCPGPFTKAKVLQGIRTGAITWHAHPHNAQYELYDPSLLQFSVDLVHDLDRRFGFEPKHTIILRDVPGLTRAVIPVLAAKGVKAVSVGVNPGSAPPGVPMFTPFIWRDEASGTQLLAFWRPGGYGGIHGGVNLDPPEQCIQAPGLGHVLCTAWRNDNAGPPLTVLEPLRAYQLLRQEWGGTAKPDSSSSSNGTVVIKASSFDAFVDAVLEALPTLNLTIVTGEIGDTWVFGVQSDPLKTANFRAASRARAACIADPACPSQGGSFYNFSRLLLKVPEHTWGVDIKKTLHDFVNYSNSDFYSCLPQTAAASSSLATLQAPSAAAAAAAGSVGSGFDVPDPVPFRDAPCPNYARCLHAWDRQAAYIPWALQALPAGHPVQRAYAADLASRQQLAAVSGDALLAAGAGLPPLDKLQQQRNTASKELATGPAIVRRRPRQAASGAGVRQYTCGSWQFELDEAQGGLTSLVKLYGQQRTPGTDWAASSSSSGSSRAGGVLAQIRYSGYCEASYQVIWRHYAWKLPLPWWFEQDFSGRVNSTAAWDKEVEAAGKLEEVFESFAPPPTGVSSGGTKQLQQLALRYSLPQELVEKLGAPPAMWTIISCPASSPIPGSSSHAAAGDLEVSVVWQGKRPTRLPEALWLSFQPAAAAVDQASWRLHKLGSLISPREVSKASGGDAGGHVQVMTNGSQSMHAVGEAGVSVTSAAGSELLQLKTWDVSLVSPGSPTPFPNGLFAPQMEEGVHFNLMNNVWGTNYVMWVPYTDDDVNLAFRFSIHAEQL